MPRTPKKYEKLEYEKPALTSRSYSGGRLHPLDLHDLLELLETDTVLKKVDLSDIIYMPLL